MTMRTFTVTVKVSLLEYYQVEAATPEDAIENWHDGEFLTSDDTHLDAEPLKAEEATTASTGRAS
jgi:hypothetical protein